MRSWRSRVTRSRRIRLLTKMTSSFPPMRIFSLVTVFLLFLCAMLPEARASFREATKVVQLSYGQREVTVTFTADSPIVRSRSLCDCTKLAHSGNRLVATVDVSNFARSVSKQLEATTEDGVTTRLTMDIRVPQAIETSAQSLIWKIDSPAEEKVLQIRIPKGSPVQRITSADLSGDAFRYTTKTEQAGVLYSVRLTPVSTRKRVLNRLIIRTDSADPRYASAVIYLSVQP